MDAFAVFEIDRQPYPSAELVESRYRDFSESFHPDKVHSESDKREQATMNSAELNSAHRLLSSPAATLKHFLELETGSRVNEVGKMPTGLMPVFMKVGNPIQSSDKLLKSLSECSSALERAAYAGDVMESLEQLQVAGMDVNASREQNLTRLKAEQDKWESGQRAVEGLSEIAAELSFLEKWEIQINDRLYQLMQY